jgi:L-lactate dehydrogenase complex protein LldG
VSSRDAILSAIRANRPAPVSLPDVPLFGEGRDDNLLGRFFTAFETMGGTVLDLDENDLLAAICARLASAGDVISRVPEIAGNRELDLTQAPASLADVDIAIVRAAFGIAETGTVAFSERELGVNTLAYLSQHLIVLLDPADIAINLHHAYQRPEFAQSRYLVFHTGPSATADIEGVLIRGAQGVRSLSILPLPRS